MTACCARHNEASGGAWEVRKPRVRPRTRPAAADRDRTCRFAAGRHGTRTADTASGGRDRETTRTPSRSAVLRGPGAGRRGRFIHGDHGTGLAGAGTRTRDQAAFRPTVPRQALACGQLASRHRPGGGAHSQWEKQNKQQKQPSVGLKIRASTLVSGLKHIKNFVCCYGYGL